MRRAETGSSYLERNEILRSMNFGSYSDYLVSSLWLTIRNRVHHEKGRLCVICRKWALDLHHTSYKLADLDGSSIANIHPLCRKCHERVEFKNGEKRTMKAAIDCFHSLVRNARDGKNSKKKIKKRPILTAAQIVKKREKRHARFIVLMEKRAVKKVLHGFNKNVPSLMDQVYKRLHAARMKELGRQ